jgi:DNA-binding transcriptional LysR family regulator
VTQSTVSARLQALERALGARLFARSRAGTAPTTEGLRFAPHARALHAEWAAARRAVEDAGERALVVRLGLQHDLAGEHLADWTSRFLAALPGTGIYVELDYSDQMCRDLIAGGLDFAVLFTPRPHPDLHFTGLGEIRYRMVSANARRLAEVAPDRYVRGNFAPAFDAAHRRALPALQHAPIAIGQAAAMAELVLRLDASGYLPETRAQALERAGRLGLVADAPVLTQPVHAAMTLRQRSARLQTRLLAITRAQFAAQQ